MFLSEEMQNLKAHKFDLTYLAMDILGLDHFAKGLVQGLRLHKRPVRVF